METSDRIAELLQAAREGDQDALDEVFSLVYGELHRLAHAQRVRWEGDYTLNTTALVHEAYVKLADAGAVTWKDRGHFMAVAARAMRQILVNYAQMRRAAKRGGDRKRVPLEEANPVSEDVADDVLALDDALDRLGRVSERQVRVVEARFFAGLPIDDTAEALGISPATVKRDWTLASAWLHREISLSLQ